MASDMVSTPGGFRDRSLVHPLIKGEGLRLVENALKKFNRLTNETTDLPNAPSSQQQAQAPQGGWVSFAYWNNNTGYPVSGFKTTWTVPAAPTTQDNQIVYLFNALLNNVQGQHSSSDYGILQPVLQWGETAAGGGPYWAIASWYVASTGHAYFTPLVPVNPGDTLIGVMELTGVSDGKYSYVSAFEGVDTTTLVIQDISELMWCSETLEAYNIGQCSDYPASNCTAFTSIGLQIDGKDAPLTWVPVNQQTNCGQQTQIISNSSVNGEIDICYR